jgi:hypothetical protein
MALVRKKKRHERNLAEADRRHASARPKKKRRRKLAQASRRRNRR